MAEESHLDLQALQRLSHFKRAEHHDADHLGQDMVAFFRQSVQKRQTKLAQIAAVWSQLVPELLSEHCSLESFNRGTLTVLVDTSAHLYDLKQLLLAGLEDQLRLACKSSGLRKITLKPGRWYDSPADTDTARNPRFS